MPFLIVVAALAGSVAFGWLAVELVLKVARVAGDQASPGERQGGHPVTVLEQRVVAPHVWKGGTWIGVLERLAITGAILAGQPELVAAVVAIKGLGRWADLQTTPALAERFIIGTLASYVVAAACGYAGAWALK